MRYHGTVTDKRYLLFDADNTLYDFTASETNALRRLFRSFSLDDSTLPIYHRENKACWAMYEEGTITLERLESERFRRFFSAIGCGADPFQAGRLYAHLLGEEGIMIDGAGDLLKALRKSYSLCIITNGIARIQKERFLRTGTADLYEKVFISQEIGYAKPDSRFFSHVLYSLGAEKEQCLVIGDSLTSDIKGAEGAGIDSVYISFSGSTAQNATYSVSSYEELGSLLL